MTLYLECKPDETLARALGVSRGSIIHLEGKGEVCNKLAKLSQSIGMVDDDPGAALPGYLAKLTVLEKPENLRLFVDKQRFNTVVAVHPQLEHWLIKTCRQAAVKLDQFNLSDQPAQLHSMINQRLVNLQRVIEALLQRRSRRILALQSLLGGTRR